MDANSISNNVRRLCERTSCRTTEAQTTVEQGNGNFSGRRIAYKAALQSQTPGPLGEGVQNPLLLPTSSTDVKRLFSTAMSHVRSRDTTGSPDGTFHGEGASITTWGPVLGFLVTMYHKRDAGEGVEGEEGQGDQLLNSD